MSLDLFKEVLPSILQTKKPFLTEENEKEYNSFMVNRALSYYPDTCLIANELNKYPNLDKKLQVDFLINIVRSAKRPYAKWHKKTDLTDKDLLAVKEYYNCSTAKAYELIDLLSNDQILDIKKKIYKGD